VPVWVLLAVKRLLELYVVTVNHFLHLVRLLCRRTTAHQSSCTLPRLTSLAAEMRRLLRLGLLVLFMLTVQARVIIVDHHLLLLLVLLIRHHLLVNCVMLLLLLLLHHLLLSITSGVWCRQ
jgi:hypothetical protein